MNTPLFMRSPESDIRLRKLRFWIVPAITFILVVFNQINGVLGSAQVTLIAAVAIVLAGIPHGALDIEIAATRFGRTSAIGKIAITLGYVACAAAMAGLWSIAPSLALMMFLVVSIFHFGGDWREGVDPFLAVMVGWALIALPALSHPVAVATIFETLTRDGNGSVIAAVLACASVPAALGSLIFAGTALSRRDWQTGGDLICCLIAALTLPPLIAFAVFFCCLHSPRHLLDAVRSAGPISSMKKTLISVAVIALTVGLGVVMFNGADTTTASLDGNMMQTAFVLLSVLTAPHFILEFIMERADRRDALPVDAR
jgi:beta-carotene 15,15'-dioxygenase